MLMACCSSTTTRQDRVLTSAAGGRSAGRCARQDSTSAFSSGAQFPGIGLRYPYATLQHTHIQLPAAQRRPASRRADNGGIHLALQQRQGCNEGGTASGIAEVSESCRGTRGCFQILECMTL
jgi:hypothetical protein